MLRIAIVEDDDSFAEELQTYLRQFGQESGRIISCGRYRDGAQIASDYQGEYDIILMDIQMPAMDGMTAAEKIREKDRQVIIIFITNRTDYAIRGYQVDALDYVLKPVNYISLAQKMDRALERIANRQARRIALNTRNGLLRLDVGKIYYVESQGHNITYYTQLGDYTLREKLSDAEQTLGEESFFRINKGCLVNLRHVDGVQENCALVKGNRLPVSRSRRPEFMAALTRYLGDS